jgi:predicted DNA-binding transcriptional regulator AlpA
MKNTNQQVKVRNYNEELYNLKELENIKKQLLSFPEIIRVLNKSRGSVYNLIANGKIKPVRFMDKFYFPKEQIYHLINPIEEQSNTDWEMSKEYKRAQGIEEDKTMPKKKIDKETGKQILQDNKTKSQNKPNRDALNIRMKR